jgi:pimeloyl-ACP methyl ester carboxylesterase
LIIAKFLSLISSKLTTLFIAKLFSTPIKHTIPKREMEMDINSIQEKVLIPSINKEVVVYNYGESNKKILLVHGWSGRGTQLYKIADELLKNGFSTISFDAPGHGKSAGNSTIMVEFIETILYLEKQYGNFEAAIGHSLGGISLLNATRNGLKINHLITIGSADFIKDIIDDFVFNLKLKPKLGDSLQYYFEKKYRTTMDDLSAYIAAREIEIPVLIIHDNDDAEVSVKCAINIHKNLKNGQLMITKGLGHRKILENEVVIEKVVDFLNNN